MSAGPTGSLEPLSETSYRLQLNTSEALKQKLELARDLMSHANPSGDLAVVVERALDVLIEKLQAQRFGQTARPHRKAGERGIANNLASPSADERSAGHHLDRSKHENDDSELPRHEHWREERRERSSRRAHIAHETRRQLLARDGLCCSYVSEDGRRCRARAFLQIHHERPWARGGGDTLDNLRLLCQAHNQLLAEREYGALYVRASVERQRRAQSA